VELFYINSFPVEITHEKETDFEVLNSDRYTALLAISFFFRIIVPSI